MKLYKRFTVLNDGCLIDDFTGAVLWPKENDKGQQFHWVSDGKKNHFWLLDNLMKLKEEYETNRLQTIH
jgi:hypothetical protein